MTNFILFAILLLLSFQQLVKTITFTTIYLKIGSNVGARVKNNIINLLHRVDRLKVADMTDIDFNSTNLFSSDNESTRTNDIKDNTQVNRHTNSLLLLIGNSTEANEFVPQAELDSLEHESYIILSTFFYPTTHPTTANVKYHDTHKSNNSHHATYKATDTLSVVPTLVCNGLPLDSTRHTNISFDKDAIHYGAVLAGYVCLERLGFGFIHPLEFYIPSVIRFDPANCQNYSSIPSPSSSLPATHSAASFSFSAFFSSVMKAKPKRDTTARTNTKSHSTISNNIESSNSDSNSSSSNSSMFCLYKEVESPYWPERSFHIHTQHPLELTEVLQGHDIPQFGPIGPHCEELWSSKYQSKRSAFSFSSSSTHNTSDISGNIHGNSPGSSGSSSSHNRPHHPKFTFCERWEDMVSDVDSLFQWAIANRLNKIEWLLLGSYKWGEGQELDTRKKRLRVLTALAHEYSLLVGADCPIGNIQQHAWSMVDIHLPLKQQHQQIRQRIDWVFDANFDFITTESGLSEFTHPECELMLSLINEFAEYANGTWQREAGIKVHCSTGQKCKNLKNPYTNESINFNFLPLFATSKLAIFPHTVQVYALDDLTSGAYGNDNFSYIEDYMVYEAKRGQRSVMFYGETAYWVNVDVDVPLFLPIYGQRRLHDLRRIAGREIKEAFRIDGQMNFDSGWEWGYWLSDVVTARASWNPLLSTRMKELNDRQHEGDEACPVSGDTSCSNDNAGVANDYKERDDQWEAFSESLYPITSLFGAYIGTKLNKLIVKLSQKQADLLIYGGQTTTTATSAASVGSTTGSSAAPVNMKKLSGMAYMSGNDPWIDLPRLVGLPLLQPNKVSIRDTGDPDWPHALRLLDTMQLEFARLAEEMSELASEAKLHSHTHHQQQQQQQQPEQHQSASKKHRQRGTRNKNKVSANKLDAVKASPTPYSEDTPYQDEAALLNDQSLALLKELQDCFELLALRAKHVHALYLSRDPIASPTEAQRAALQKQSRVYINQAALIVAEREKCYRVPWERVASWRENPTVYRYGYLWSVHSLYYWWRDQGLAEQGSLQSELSPCYLNRIDVTETAVGWGKYIFELLRKFINNYSPFARGYPLELINCIAPPTKEYIFPRDLYPYE